MRAFSAHRFVFALLLGLGTFTVASCAVGENDSPLEAQIRSRAAGVEKKVIAWREDIHQHPELGQQELRTSHLVAQHLQSLGLEVRTNVALTGVIGLLRGERPGPTVALRADMDALPVKEPEGLPFASKARSRIWARRPTSCMLVDMTRIRRC